MTPRVPTKHSGGQAFNGGGGDEGATVPSKEPPPFIDRLADKGPDPQTQTGLGTPNLRQLRMTFWDQRGKEAQKSQPSALWLVHKYFNHWGPQKKVGALRPGISQSPSRALRPNFPGRSVWTISPVPASNSFCRMEMHLCIQLHVREPQPVRTG